MFASQSDHRRFIFRTSVAQQTFPSRCPMCRWSWVQVPAVCLVVLQGGVNMGTIEEQETTRWCPTSSEWSIVAPVSGVMGP